MITIRLPPDIERRIDDFVSRAGHELEEKYLALNRLENPAERWTLDDLEQGLDTER